VNDVIVNNSVSCILCYFLIIKSYKDTKRRRGKERVEWGRGPWRAILAFLPRGPRVPRYTTDFISCRPFKLLHVVDPNVENN